MTLATLCLLAALCVAGAALGRILAPHWPTAPTAPPQPLLARLRAMCRRPPPQP